MDLSSSSAHDNKNPKWLAWLETGDTITIQMITDQRISYPFPPTNQRKYAYLPCGMLLLFLPLRFQCDYASVSLASHLMLRKYKLTAAKQTQDEQK